LNDHDHDGFCAEVDNCPTITNADQADSNQDGSGDACQPTLDLIGIQEDGGTDLEVTVAARDPQGEPLGGSIDIVESNAEMIEIPNYFNLDLDAFCRAGYLPNGLPGEGIGYFSDEAGVGLVDLSYLCGGGVQYGLADGSCEAPTSPFFQDYYLYPFQADHLDPPLHLCVRPLGDSSSGIDFTILGYDANSLRAVVGSTNAFSVHIPFENGLPAHADISALRQGPAHTLSITVTDGNTLPVTVESQFLYQGETVLTIIQPAPPNRPPQAMITAPARVECGSPAGGAVTLDGSGSTDPDSTASANDIVGYDWIEDFGAPTQRVLGTGATLAVVLPLGPHAITLRVTDRQGLSSTAPATVTVADTIPPSLALTVDPAVLWPPNHRLVPVQVAWQAGDACSPAVMVTLVSAVSSEPDDAPGEGDGRTTGDVVGAAPGTAATSIELRAERSGSGAGRTYALTYRATDAAGNAAPALALVSVPHDLGEGPEPLQLRLEHAGANGAARAYWNAVNGARAYDLIRGDLASLRQEIDRVSLGTVTVPARETAVTTWSGGMADNPAPGRGFFYLVQSRDALLRPSGFGTESVPLPRLPAGCEGGCPGDLSTPTGGADRQRK
jgi:hypothetical protein